MAKNFIQKGKEIRYVVQEGDVIKSGDLVAVGSVVGVAITDGQVGYPLTVSVVGVYRVPLPAALGDVPQGTKLYFNATDKEVSLTNTHLPLGYAWENGIAGGTIDVSLNR